MTTNQLIYGTWRSLSQVQQAPTFADMQQMQLMQLKQYVVDKGRKSPLHNQQANKHGGPERAKSNIEYNQMKLKLTH